MKPLKGMNQDVSGANMPAGSYRRAQNFIYGQELDALLQEPGLELLNITLAGGDNPATLCGLHALPEDNFLVFQYNQGAIDGSGSRVARWDKSTGALTTILVNNALLFKPTTVLSIENFQNAAGETIVVFTDNVNPIRVLNLTTPDTDMTTNKLFPDFDLVQVSVDASKGSGRFPTGTHFFAIAYEQEDGSRTSFQGLHGPFPVKEESGSFDLELSNVDQDYPYILIASLTFTGTSLEAKVQRRFSISSASLERTIDNVNPYGELTVAELVSKPQVYTKAKTMAFQDNRVYLGNVTEHSEADLQSYANTIEPIWVYGNTAKGGNQQPPNLSETFYPENLRFMPGEVYAFYVAWVRSDGSETKAFHIPARNLGTSYNLLVEPLDNENLSANNTITINPTDTLANITNSDSAGNLNYLKYDQSSGNTYYYQSRDTCTENTSVYGVGETGRKRGRMSVWLNDDETYPTGFPDLVRYAWHQPSNALQQTTTTLAGTKVRHHKIPTSSWLDRNTSLSVSGFTARPTVSVEFEHVPLPVGYTGVRFFYAKRTVNNSTILGQSLLFHGAFNHYSAEAVGENASDYIATNGWNTAVLNYAPGGTNANNGNSFGFGPNYSAWQGQMQLDRGRMHPFDMMRTKPRISEIAGRNYVRFDYIVGKMADPHTSGPAPWSTDVYYWQFVVDEDSPFDITELYGFDNFESTKYRNRIVRFNYNLAPTVHVPTEQMALRPVEGAHYQAPGVFDTEKLLDNRGGEECLTFKIKHDVQGVDMHFPLASEYDHYEDRLGNTWTGNSRTARTGMWLNNGGSINPGHLGSASRPVSVAPLANFCVSRENVYQGYASQELVACTPVMSVLDTPRYSNDSGNKSPVDLAAAIASFVAGVASVGKVDYTHTFGDMSLSEHRYRTTAFAGWTHGYANDNVNTPSNVDDGYSPAPDAGTIRVSHKVQMYTSANPYFIDNEQSRMDDYKFLADNSRSIVPDETNDYTIDLGFLKLNDFRQPGIFDVTETYSNEFPYRVHRSQAQAADEPDINIRTFLAFDSYEQPRNRGTIQNLEAYVDKLLIHHERGLFVTRGKESLATTGGQIAFGTGDIFAVPPTEVVPTPNGFAGTQHPLSCLMTPAGYFFADVSQGKLFKYTDQLQEISAMGLKAFFRDRLTNLNFNVSTSGQTMSFHPGVSTVYDPRWNRVIFHIRDTASNTVPDVNFNADQGTGEASPGYASTNNRDVYVSFNIDLSTWTSFHTYNWVGAVSTENELYSFSTLKTGTNAEDRLMKLGRHNDLTQPFGKFHGLASLNRADSFIDAVLTYQDGVVFSNVNWYTKAMDHAVSTLGFVDHDRTFTHATIYNDYQCSNEVALVRAVQSKLVDRTANLRADDYRWKWNDFRDQVADRTARFVDKDGNLIPDNLANSKNWFEQRRLTSNNATVRLRYNNAADSTIGLYLYDIDAKVRKSYR